MNSPVSSMLETLIADLDAESARLRGRVATLDAADWGTPTPAPGWTIAHQIAHLTWTDEASCTAIEDPDAFTELVAKATADPDTFVEDAADELVTASPGDLLGRWDAGRTRVSRALRGVPDGTRISWYGPPMSASSMATARLMETWAHGHDVAEALGVSPEPTARTKHVAYLGVRTRDFAYHVNARTPPAEEFRVELTGPDGEVWAWGPEGATERVTGSGHDFALLVTRRRHPDDVDVHAEGDQATLWLTIAQAFAGRPGPEPVRLAGRGART